MWVRLFIRRLTSCIDNIVVINLLFCKAGFTHVKIEGSNVSRGAPPETGETKLPLEGSIHIVDSVDSAGPSDGETLLLVCCLVIA